MNMSCSIEALQSKAKLRDVRQQQFQRKLLWPELAQRETETIVESASHRMKAIMESALAKMRGAIGAQQPAPPAPLAPRVSGSVNSQGEDEKEGEESVDISKEANDEGFY